MKSGVAWIHARVSLRGMRALKRSLGVLLFLLLWEVGAYLIKLKNPQFHSNIFPSIAYIFTESLTGIATFATVDLVRTQQSSVVLALIVLAQNSVVTLTRLLGGSFIGIGVGIMIGIGIGISKLFRRLFGPLLNVVRTVPLLALIPLFLVWFGGAEIGIYLYIIFGLAMFMLVYTANAVQNVQPIYIEFAKTLGASKGQVFRTVILPAIVPELAGGTRVCLGIAWGITLAGEYLAAQDGLGRILIWSQIYMFAGRMVIIVLLFMMYAILINTVVLRLKEYAAGWMP